MSNEIRSTMHRALRFAAFLPLAFAGLLFNSSAFAQEDQQIFEEIVVTVQKREQNIMDVPVAVTAVTGLQIQASGINDVFDLQQNVPSLIVNQSQSSTTSSFGIRSISSTSNNFGVESSVGLYVDGIYRSRQSSMINDLIDVEAVEVLRGPQGTLFGKNTPAGAISVRTVRPGQDFDAFIETTAGDRGLVKLSAAANIPINEKLAFRGTIFASQRDGYIDDVRFGENVLNDRDRMGARLQLAYNEPNDDLNWRLIADYSEIDEICCVGVTRVDNLYSRNSLTNPATGPVTGTDASIFLLGGTVFTDFPYAPPFIDGLTGLPPCGSPPQLPCIILPGGSIQTGVGFDDYTAAVSFLPESSNEDRGLSFEINKSVGDSMTFTSVSGYRAFDTLDFVDVDFTDVAVLNRTNDAEQSSFSQEFRLSGEFGEGSNFVVGAYYFDQEIVNLKTTNDDGLLSIFLSTDPRIVAIGQGIQAAADEPALGGLIQAPGSPAVLPNSTALDDVTQNHESWAVFGQVDFALSDAFTLTLGARYTEEKKDFDAIYTSAPLPSDTPRADLVGVATQLCLLSPACYASLPPGTPPFNPAVALPIFEPFYSPGWGIFAFDPLGPRPNLQESISDDQVTGTAKMTWYASDNTMFYASYATGYKSGGTNDDRLNPVFDQVFGPETSESFEIGFKGDLGPVRLGIAVYDTTYEDFQAQSFTGTGFNLQNAGDLDTQGIEVEFVWRPFDGTEVQGYYARNEGKYKSFANGTCRDAYQFHSQLPDPGLLPSANPFLEERCERSGDILPYNPENQFFVALRQDIEVGENNLYFRGELQHQSEMFTDGDIDPFTRQPNINLVNLRIGYEWIDANAELTLWGRNVTDVRWYHGSFDAPAQEGHMNSYPSEPASFGVTFRKSFD